MAELKNIRIAVSGIYEYALNELGSLQLSLSNAPDWVEEKSIYRVYRPASVLAAACQKFKLLPLTHHHPPTTVDSSNFRDLVIGYTGENPFIDYIESTDEVGIRSNVLLYDNEAKEAYARGEIQLSPGYAALFVWQKGASPHGEEYDIVMQEIKSVNHVALLPAGRGGQEARVLDAQPAQTTIFDMVHMVHTTRDKEDANGAQHSDDNGQFVGNDGCGKSKKTNDEYRKEIKEKLKNILHKDLPNEATGISASISSEGLNKMMSGAAIKKSIDNGFTPQEHFEAVGNVAALFRKSKLIAVRPDEKHNDPNVTIKRFVAQDTLKDGKEADFLFTLKETQEHGHRIYSLELDEINKASLRWQSTKDGKAVFQVSQTLTTGSPKNSIAHDTKTRKNIFECVQGTVFDWCGA